MLKKGILPEKALYMSYEGKSIFEIGDGVNQNILDDIAKLKKCAEDGIDPIDAFIPEFDNSMAALRYGNFKAGDIYGVKNGVDGKYEIQIYKGNNRVSILSTGIDRETYFDLFPLVKRFFSRQGKSGTCYELASYNSMLDNNYSRSAVMQRIKADDNGLFVSTPRQTTNTNRFSGYASDIDKYGSVKTYLTGNKFIAPNDLQNVSSTEGIKALEYLYGKKRKYEIANAYIDRVEQIHGKEAADKMFDKVLKNIDNIVFDKNDYRRNGKFTIKTLEEVSNADTRGRVFVCPEDYYKEGGTHEKIFSLFEDFYKPVKKNDRLQD